MGMIFLAFLFSLGLTLPIRDSNSLSRQERQYYNPRTYGGVQYQTNNYNYNYDYNSDYGQQNYQQNQNTDICDDGSYRSMMDSDDKGFFDIIKDIFGGILG